MKQIDEIDDVLPITPSRLKPLLEPVQAFFSAESAGGIMLMLATAIALIIANSPFGDAYSHFWHSYLTLSFGSHSFKLSAEHWVNDGLMVIFFLLVGLEIKRELMVGELSSVRKAALPVAAALGGMLIPAGIYALINIPYAGHGGTHGWGIPMATDIAFAVGIVAIVGRSLPTSMKILLLAIAIVDDLGAVMVIAVFYTSSINPVGLGIAGGFLFALVALNMLRVHHPAPYILLGVGLWLGTLISGIHATIAGVLLAFTIPVTRQIQEVPYLEYMRRMLSVFERDAKGIPDHITHTQSHALQAMAVASGAVQTPLARIEHVLLKPVNLLIVPLFAFANAGVDLRGGVTEALSSPVTYGVLFGLVLGKPVGVLLASLAAVKLNFASLPAGANYRHLLAISLLCGIGFTMSLFVASLAFPGQEQLLAAAKLGILGASLVSAVAGAIVLMMPSKARV